MSKQGTTINSLFAAAFLLLPGMAVAQEAPAGEKTSAQIVCELTGDCAPPDLEATMDRPESRGFALGVPTATAPAERAPVRTAPAARKPALATHIDAPARVSEGLKVHSRSRLIAERAPELPGRSNLSIGFALGSDMLTESGRSQAFRLLDAVQSPAAAGRRFEVAGHTDSIGNRDFNLDLSRRRAEAVVRFLTDHGVAAARLEPRGYGFDLPLPGLSARAPVNRRVEIVTLEGGADASAKPRGW